MTAGRVYPRVCGGTFAGRAGTAPGEGLSPRVRGNRRGSSDCAGGGGSIPACAGEPVLGKPRQPGRRLYPRVCGGTRGGSSSVDGGEGLSPRVRGNRVLQHRNGAGGGSIPACAGEPNTGTAPGEFQRVYPRVCGGTDTTSMASARQSGLSPRVRGNRVQRAEMDVGARSIPACAGEPGCRSGDRRY